MKQTNIQFKGNLFAGYELNYVYSKDKPHQIASIEDANYRSEAKVENHQSKIENYYMLVS